MDTNYYIKIIFLATALFIACSCSTNTSLKQIPSNISYTIDIAYVEDEALPKLEPSVFFTIFDDRLPKLTKEILGYNINYNLKIGMDDNKFYYNTRSIIRKEGKRFKNENIDIQKEDITVLSSLIYETLLNEDHSKLSKLFSERTLDKREVENIIAPSIIQNIFTVWNSKATTRNRVLNTDRQLMYFAEYWRIIASRYEKANIIIVNIPLAATYHGMSTKAIAEGGFIDRLVVYNRKSKPTKTVSVLSIYPLLSDDKVFLSKRGEIDSNLEIDILTYYTLQTVAMMTKRYDIHDETYSIMAEVPNFDYKTWYSNISNNDLREPYNVLTHYPDSLK